MFLCCSYYFHCIFYCNIVIMRTAQEVTYLDVNNQLSVYRLSGLHFICAWLVFLYKCRHMWTSLSASLPALGGGLEGSTEDKIKQHFFFLVLYCQCRWWHVELCSTGEGGGKRGYYRCAWSFLNSGVLQWILLWSTVFQVKMIVNACGPQVRWLKIRRKLYW
jgi:hypothetical protein